MAQHQPLDDNAQRDGNDDDGQKSDSQELYIGGDGAGFYLLQEQAGWGWLDLLSSIPMVDALRWGRLARVLRIIRQRTRLHRRLRAVRAQSGADDRVQDRGGLN